MSTPPSFGCEGLSGRSPTECRGKDTGIAPKIVGGTPYSNYRNGMWVPVEAVIG